MKTTTKVRKWGNSLAVRIPSAIVQEIGLSGDSSVQITSNGTTLTLKPQSRKKLTLDNLLNQVTPDNLHDETDWGEATGKEAW